MKKMASSVTPRAVSAQQYEEILELSQLILKRIKEIYNTIHWKDPDLMTYPPVEETALEILIEQFIFDFAIQFYFSNRPNHKEMVETITEDYMGNKGDISLRKTLEKCEHQTVLRTIVDVDVAKSKSLPVKRK